MKTILERHSSDAVYPSSQNVLGLGMFQELDCNTSNLINCHIELRVSTFFPQKLTSWVFNDQPCECAGVGHSGTIGRAAKMGWEKKGSPVVVPVWRTRSDFIYTKNSARPGSGFSLHKE